jgi:hypothetical protein
MTRLNSDGRGRRRCSHDTYMFNVYKLLGDGRSRHTYECGKCHAWLSLGPANDADPRVAVEVRAAEIASIGRDAASMWMSNEMSDSERDGWGTHMRDWDHITIEGAEWAGYLAAAIASHGDE